MFRDKLIREMTKCAIKESADEHIVIIYQELNFGQELNLNKPSKIWKCILLSKNFLDGWVGGSLIYLSFFILIKKFNNNLLFWGRGGAV